MKKLSLFFCFMAVISISCTKSESGGNTPSTDVDSYGNDAGIIGENDQNDADITPTPETELDKDVDAVVKNDEDETQKPDLDMSENDKDLVTDRDAETINLDVDTVLDSDLVPDSDVDGVTPECTAAGYPKCNENSVATCSDGKIVENPCGEEKCDKGACKPVICTPNEFTCKDDLNYSQCDSKGIKLIDGTCGENNFCSQASGGCECEVPVNIMFVLDASGSMMMKKVGDATQWSIALDAIASVMSKYPRLNYGLATFPDIDLAQSDINSGLGGCKAEYTDNFIFDVQDNSNYDSSLCSSGNRNQGGASAGNRRLSCGKKNCR